MSKLRKHTDVVASMEEFTTNYEQGLYAAPWIVYVGNDDTGYSVVYSNDEKRSHASADMDFIDSLANRVIALETEKVFCFEEEYDALVENGRGWVTNIDGTRSEVVFDENKLYCIYEEEGPSEPVTPEEPEEPTEPDEPVEPTPEEPTEPEDPVEPTPEESETPEEPTV